VAQTPKGGCDSPHKVWVWLGVLTKFHRFDSAHAPRTAAGRWLCELVLIYHHMLALIVAATVTVVLSVRR
jgi:hypothetical protein